MNLRLIHGWTLLTSESDYEIFHEQNEAEAGSPPLAYPVLATPVFGFGGSDREYLYLDAPQLDDMQEALTRSGAAVV
ncbi:MAG: hypothetical protein ABIY70_08980 [Capsulimonas sp.]|uniref:hypothetical protein n=1 Tax=Capsulimonas sp. TaxID=2494211 RepID=UPI003266E23E